MEFFIVNYAIHSVVAHQVIATISIYIDVDIHTHIYIYQWPKGGKNYKTITELINYS